MAAVIQTKALEKHYQMGSETLRALKGIDVQINTGEFVAVMGPSGSGKSTFMNMLGCLDIPTCGQILLQGEDVTHLPAATLAQMRNKYIGFIFQQFNLLPRTSALDNVVLPMLYNNTPRQQALTQARECLELVGLGSRTTHQPSQLSGGQQQRVAIARALVNQPALLLADEPTGALDTETGLEIMQLFQQLHRQGKTLVLVTHEPDIAEFASRQLVFRDGKLVSDKRSTPACAQTALAHFRQQRLAEALA
ncbi:ABC transporter ATP-binding protein [Rheinheimera baltica]|uniref:ABC transporter ATP-binding protein n=1 Tax=Rheinheimera baltica TaxID=67576 RepID=UPI00273D87DD|nr:ABC transporter ATP-binding protein [Rheinheimera baltica]MDP5143128.1 ABC transporter ATP-binding protein [Rheinheimera baltica]MDP5149838.1 ABC transporter ATP-binding protein [Rheinheimera baltica]MDP5189492.1 ABC transporter ATP-binding protein [Rheinheimera baltica]